MLIFGERQRQAFRCHARTRFVSKTLEFLAEEMPDWYRFTADAEKTAFVETMLDLAHECRLFEALSAQKLAYFKLKFDFAMPLTEAHRTIIDRPGFDEEIRMSQFLQYLTSDGTVSIVSSEELKSMKRDNEGGAGHETA